MYFSFSWPKSFFPGTEDPPIYIKFSREGSLVAILSGNTIVIWSGGQQRVPLGLTKRSDEDIRLHGLNKAMVWSPASTMIAIVTEGGHILMYSLRHLEKEDPLEYKFSTTKHDPHHHFHSLSSSHSQTPHNTPLRRIQLEFCTQRKIPYGGATSISTDDDDHILIATREGYLVSMLWESEIKENVNIADILWEEDTSPENNNNNNNNNNTKNNNNTNNPTSSELLLKNSVSVESVLNLKDDPQSNIHSTSSPQFSTPSLLANDLSIFPNSPPFPVTQKYSIPKEHSKPNTPKKESIIIPPLLLPKENSDLETKIMSDPNKYTIRHMVYCSSESVFGMVFADGRAAIITVQQTNPNNQNVVQNNNATNQIRINTLKLQGRMRGITLRGVTNAVCISLNVKHRVVAVGCENGDTKLFLLPRHLWTSSRLITTPKTNSSTINPSTTTTTTTTNTTQTSQEKETNIDNKTYKTHCPHLRTYTLSHWGIHSDDIGWVSSLAWTPDESALAVGWGIRGLCIWSLYGCKLLCTIPQLEGFESFTREPLKGGVSAMAWGSEGYNLLATSREDKGELLQFNFVKGCMMSNPSLNHSDRLLLQADDRLLFLNYRGKEPGDISWQHIPLPTNYIQDNYPIRHVAVNREGTLIAVAGKRGVVVYSIRRNRWRLFGDRNQEQEILSCGLAFFQKSLIILNDNRTARKIEFLFYPRDHLAQTSLQHRSFLPRRAKPLFVDCDSNNLLIFTADSFLYFYRIHTQNSPTITNNNHPHQNVTAQTFILDLLYQVSMSSIAHPLSIVLLPTEDQNNAPEELRCLVLHATGRLTLFNPSNAHEKVLVSEGVEQFWLTNRVSPTFMDSPLNPDQEIGCTLWAYGENGLEVLFPFRSAKELEKTRVDGLEKSLDFDFEVYPVGFVAELGVIVGLAQGFSYSPVSTMPYFEIHTKTHPFLHSMLRHLLNREDEDRAYSIAMRFAFIPHFPHSLELLLHETLELETEGYTRHTKRSSSGFFQSEENWNGENGQELNSSKEVTKQVVAKSCGLATVSQFLRRFLQFPDIVVQCARKTDAAHWKYLFSIVGDPKWLFEQCVLDKRIETAASYLKILQNIEGPVVARRGALKLLELVLENDDLELAGELVRFLEPISESDLPSQSQSEFAMTIDDQEYLMQGLLLARYARKLLSQKQLRHLLLFARRVGQDIRPWLIREKRRAALLDSASDISEALQTIHLQFYMPYPSVLTPVSQGLIQAVLASRNNAIGVALGAVNMNNNTSNSNSGTSTPPRNKNPYISPPESPYISRNTESSLEEAAESNDSSENSTSPVLATKRLSFLGSLGIPIAPLTPSPSLSEYPLTSPLFLQESILSSSQDLQYLLQEMLASHCTEWALVIATVLLNTPLVLAILKDNQSLWKLFYEALHDNEALQDRGGSGYTELLNYLEEFFPLSSKWGSSEEIDNNNNTNTNTHSNTNLGSVNNNAVSLQ